MCHDTQQAKATRRCLEMTGVEDSAVDAVGVDIFDGDNGVVYCLMLAPCSMAYWTVDAADSYSRYVQYVVFWLEKGILTQLELRLLVTSIYRSQQPIDGTAH